MFLKTDSFTTPFTIPELESRFKQYFKRNWKGTGYFKDDQFLMKEQFTGRGFKIYAEGKFTDNGNSTKVEVQYKMTLFNKVVIIMVIIFYPCLYIYLKLSNNYFIGSGLNNNWDVLLLFAPVFTLGVSYFTFYEQYCRLEKIINSICKVK